MKIILGKCLDVTTARIGRLISDIERAFSGIPEYTLRTYSATLNFAAPGAVPGITSQTVTIDGVELGDTVMVAAPITAPAGFLPPVGEVTAANTVKVHWLQFSGAAADPDGSGGSYTIDVWRH